MTRLTRTGSLAKSASLGALILGIVVGASRAQSGSGAETLALKYATHVAANEAAADEWRGSPASDSSEAECDAGSTLWRRDRASTFCAALCATDIDCGPADGRCRVIDVENLSKVPEFPFMDEIPNDEVDAWLEGINPDRPPVSVCDPFWEIAGATDADLLDL